MICRSTNNVDLVYFVYFVFIVYLVYLFYLFSLFYHLYLVYLFYIVKLLIVIRHEVPNNYYIGKIKFDWLIWGSAGVPNHKSNLIPNIISYLVGSGSYSARSAG